MENRENIFITVLTHKNKEIAIFSYTSISETDGENEIYSFEKVDIYSQ